ncbi:MAG: hypothetical protein E7507_05040 [Ruminococcus sp.]|nr:hypothetical protein [Ruminococcus sp.]
MIKRMITRLSSFVVSAVMLLFLVHIPTFAENGDTAVVGKLYEFGEKSEYEISSAESYTATTKDNTYGEFLLGGNVKSVADKNGVPAYEIADGELSLIYEYDDTLLNAGIDSWHLYSDSTEKIDGKSIGGEIKKGTIWLQTSMDRMNWTNAVRLRNIFSTTPTNSEAFYTAKDIELINGCYYKVVVAYETRIRTENSNFLFIDTDKFNYKKYAEVYEFYAYTSNGNADVIDKTYSLGKRVRVENFDSYSGETAISEKDPHKDWDLGNFFVSGYTQDITDENGNVVFLKNVGDKVALYFRLNQDIDKLDGKDNLSITADTDGYDEYFEKGPMNFGRGALFIKYTDRNNESEIIIYTDYLKANTSFGADTKVQLFEEGDYEVALDYEVTEDGFIDSEGHYRIFFKFSVRNGNCMVYPFDIVTGSELTNSSMTENGFRLDLAKSRYLNVNIKREVLKDSADGLVEDTRFNGPAKDGAEYTEEGIYTITVSNNYTNQFTVKKIYVGTNNILRAYMTTGLSIPEINNLVAEGATILDDGTIKLADKVVESETEAETTQPTEATTETTTEETVDVMADVDTEKKDNSVTPIVILIAIGGVVLVGAIVAVVMMKKKVDSNPKSSETDSEGGTEE